MRIKKKSTKNFSLNVFRSFLKNGVARLFLKNFKAINKKKYEPLKTLI